MAVIKRFQGNQVFNQPVGVVRPSSAGVQFGQAMQRVGTQMFQAAYEREVVNQKQLGKEAGMQVNIELRDADNKLVIAKAPEGLSPVAERAAQPVIDKRYVDALNIDMKNRAATIRADYKNDPEGFDEAYSAYVNETIDQAGRYAEQARIIGATYAGQHSAALYAEKLEFEDRLDFQNSFGNLRQEIEDIQAYASSPDEIGINTAGNLARRHDDLVRDGGIIDQFAQKHGARLGVTQITELKHAANAAFYSGKAISIAAKLDAFAEAQNPFVKSSIVTSHLRYMQDALRKGSVDTLPDAIKNNLAKLGFDNDFLTEKGMGRVRDTVASKIAVIEGNKQEIFNAERAEKQLQIISRKVEAGVLVSGDDAQALLNTAGMSDAYALGQNIATILANPEDPNLQPFYRVLIGNSGELPQAAKDLLSDEGIIRDIVTNDPNMLPVLQNFYKQATTFNRGGFSTSASRGLSEDAAIFWDTFDAYSNSVRTMSVDQFFARKTEIDSMQPSLKDDILKKNLGKNLSLLDFVQEQTGAENAEQLNFFMSYADELVIMHGKEKAGKILKSSGKKVFRKSDFIFGDAASRYAPEIAYNDNEIIVLTNSINNQMKRLGGGYQIKTNVFLAPDPREGSVLPVYTLVNENGVPYMVGSEVLQVGPQDVLAARQLASQKTIDQLRAEARQERERYLRTMSFVDPAKDAPDTTVGTIAGGRIDISEFE